MATRALFPPLINRVPDAWQSFYRWIFTGSCGCADYVALEFPAVVSDLFFLHLGWVFESLRENPRKKTGVASALGGFGFRGRSNHCRIAMPVAKPVSSDSKVIAHIDLDCFYVQGPPPSPLSFLVFFNNVHTVSKDLIYLSICSFTALNPLILCRSFWISRLICALWMHMLWMLTVFFFFLGLWDDSGAAEPARAQGNTRCCCAVQFLERRWANCRQLRSSCIWC